MKAIFNGELLDFDQIKLDVRDRGFQYGDGLFETIAVVEGQPRFLDKHFERVVKGCKILSLQIPELTIDVLSEYCERLLKSNGIVKNGKIRFSIWRKEGGLYMPSGVKINFMISSHSVDSPVFTAFNHVGFSESVVNYPTSYSSFKTMSALKYVIAGLEKKEKGYEEIILNDHNGFVSETLDSNIFTVKGGIYSTPPIATGCIDGIMRNWIINELKSAQIPIEERFIIPNEMLDADAVFTTNALGIRHILQIQNVSFSVDQQVQELIESIS